MDVELDPATGEVLIPTNDYHQARISLAAQGLPEYSANGFEDIDNLPLGVSRSVETMKLKKVQENELSRSIAVRYAISCLKPISYITVFSGFSAALPSIPPLLLSVISNSGFS